MFDLILYVPSTIFQVCRDGSSWVEPVLSHAQGHNASDPGEARVSSQALYYHCAPFIRFIRVCSVYLLFNPYTLFVGVLCLSLFCYALFSVHSSFAIILKRKRKLVALLVLQTYCYCKFSMTLPHGAKGWSAVYDCGIS